jgi:hypothetical protein
VAGADDQRIGHLCKSEMHTSCPHKVGGRVRLFSRKRGSVASLCDCNCHGTCALGNQSEVTDEEWAKECTCPGGVALREVQHRVREKADLRKSQQEEVFRDVDLGHEKSAEQIRREILAAYAAKGYEAPSDFNRISRFVAASTAHRGTRTVRLSIEIVESLRAARRWAKRNIPESDHPDNEKELGRMRRSAGAFTALATTAAVGAYCTRGFPRLVLVVFTTVFGVLAAWVGLWVTAINSITSSRPSVADPT